MHDGISDDINMPMVNEWGDQPTLECASQLIADGTFSFLDKDRRVDSKLLRIHTMWQPASPCWWQERSSRETQETLFYL